jgi:hypothetical protein
MSQAERIAENEEFCRDLKVLSTLLLSMQSSGLRGSRLASILSRISSATASVFKPTAPPYAVNAAWRKGSQSS